MSSSCFIRIYMVILIVLSCMCYSCASVPMSPSDALCNEGFKAYLNRDWDKSISYYNQALGTESSSTGNFPPYLCVYQYRPYSYARIGKFKEAIDDVNVLMNMTSSHYTSYIARCEVLSRYGRHKEALDDCETALKKKPKDTILMRYNADALIRAGKIDEGLRLYDKVINETGSPHFALFAKAETLDEAGMSKDALLAYKVALSYDEDSDEAERKEKVGKAITHGITGYLTVAKKGKFTEGMIKFAKQRIAELEKLK